MAKNSQPSENVLLNFAHFNKILPAIIHDDQAPVVYKLDSAIHRINHYPALDKYWGGGNCTIQWIEIYPVDSVIHVFNMLFEVCSLKFITSKTDSSSKTDLHTGTHITRDICFPSRGTHITKDICFPGRGTHLTREMCFPGGEHISLGICVSQVREHISLGIYVSQVGEHISLGIYVSQVGELISLGIYVSQVREHISLGICVSG